MAPGKEGNKSRQKGWRVDYLTKPGKLQKESATSTDITLFHKHFLDTRHNVKPRSQEAGELHFNYYIGHANKICD